MTGVQTCALPICVRYINDRFLPDKALDLIDEASSKVQLAGYKVPEGIVEKEETIHKLISGKEEALKCGDIELAKELQREQDTLKEELEKAKPFPLQKHELDPILKNMGISTSAIEIDYAVGDEVNVISGPFAGKRDRKSTRLNSSHPSSSRMPSSA